MKRVLLFLSLLVFLMSGCSNKDKEIAGDVVEQINQIQAEGIPSQRIFDNIYDEYSNLTDKQKKLVENYEILDQYKGLNLDRIININDLIKQIETQDSVKYSKILEVEAEYNNLTKDDKEFIENYNIIEKAKELTEVEKAAVAAVNTIKDSLKDPSSLELVSISVKDELERMNFYFVYITYSATNGFGARQEDKACLSITEEYEDPFYALAVLSGKVKDHLKSTSSFMEFIKSEKPEIEIDCDKILDNLE